MNRTLLLASLAVIALVACRPKVPPLRGDVAPARIPAARLPSHHQKVVFRWTYADRNFRARGEGVARVSPPDSVRLDFFLDRGMGGGSAHLIGNDLRAPNDRMVRSVLPPVPLLWAALGRLSIGTPPDTVARLAGDTLRVEIGRGSTWRVTFVRDSLSELMHVKGGRIQQFVQRDSARVRFRDPGASRDLQLTIVRVDTVPGGFDASIWR
ncbi:MAG TPA: hypothetical protein VJ672_16195 [Gemmatimonadaceae bacterium]|nr:hypothetical protein [Gemmatimonadaceae bacterium]